MAVLTPGMRLEATHFKSGGALFFFKIVCLAQKFGKKISGLHSEKKNSSSGEENKYWYYNMLS